MQFDSPVVLQTATWVAAHAAPLFLLALLTLLAGFSIVWQLVHRYGVHRETSRIPPLGYQVAYLLAGFVLIIGAGAFFAGVAENLGDGRKLGQLDSLFSETIKGTVSRPVLQFFSVLTHLADAATQTVICIAVALVLLWRRRFALCSVWVLAVAGNGLLNRTLKEIFKRARPLHDHGAVSASGWSFPSGHASGSVVVYGMLAYVIARSLSPQQEKWRLPVLLLAVAAAFSIGSSRVFLQLHFASDVLAGFASGTAWLAVCIGSMELLRYRQNRRATSTRT